MRKKEFGIWHDISWGEYAERAREVANGLLSLGVKKGERVALISENRPEFLFIDMGIQTTGGITTAIYTTNASAEVHYILDHSESRFYFVEDEEQLDKALEVRDRLPGLEKIIIIDMEGLKRYSDPMVMSFEKFLELGRDYANKNPNAIDERLKTIEADDTALIVYTSGTTGPPKGAMLTHKNIIWTTDSLGKTNPIYKSDEILSYLPLSHIAERVMTVFNGIYFGYTSNFIENLDTVSDNMREVSPTVVFGVPRIWEKYHSTIIIKMQEATWFKRLVFNLAINAGMRYAEAKFSPGGVPLGLKLVYGLYHYVVMRKLKERLGLERARFVISGAAPISPAVLEFYHAIGVPMREVYGQTEDAGPATIHQGDNIKLGTVGQPLPGVEIKIAEDGEILVKGGNVFKGYFKNKEATAETLIKGWLHTGDVGVMDDEGFLTITDRKKDILITSGGKNIAPQFIENKLKMSPYINDAVVIGEKRKYLTALILIDEENVTKYAQDNRIPFTTYASLSRNPEIVKLIDGEVEKVNDELARVESIKKFTILDKRLDQEDGELTPTMKVKRKQINEMYKDIIESMY
ncbi:MAG: AMP-binding protein [Deltaproteobacteria bacterium]|uniref:AMP-binding protein n=1 Tax=Candidatus Zymogenus saltonus TaxID=2844893 RepID=A0A9D8KF98_9DELT|nr:AMP-binding protein [Candidatus Zymogenus saltonus]